ncbi:MAG TPA: DUF2029 domain-containing protein, partial [Planctomycetes bacterium]|nr:DUF2029 domain-containing protein [Planctomycetota bacterium]
LRRSVYAVLIAASLGMILGRILAVDSVDRQALTRQRLAQIPAELARQRQALERQGLSGKALEAELERREDVLYQRAWLQRPFLSANDRSRWATVRALVEPEMRVPGAPYAIDKVIVQRNWDTIDMVKHDGHLYSSKPPLLATLVAGEYWLIYRVTGLVWGKPLTLGTHPYSVGRTILITFNLIPLWIYLVLLARLVERFGISVWGRVFVMGAASFGTFLSTFAVVLNNHVPAAVCALIALYAVVRIWFDGRRGVGYFFLAGLFAALAAACELPALILLALLGLVMFFQAPVRTLVGFLPGVALVAAGFFGTNWIAHHSLRPPYMHRSQTDPEDNWYSYTYEINGRVLKSYWDNPQGLDRGESDVGKYAFHVLVGHHGIFSLTPVWLLSMLGILFWIFAPRERGQRWLALVVLVATAVCLAFYLIGDRLGMGRVDRNYSGMSCGFRWMFWFAPLWLVTMLPATDGLSRWKVWRGLALLLLVASVLSASYPTWNPWTHPWLLNFLHYLRVIQV